MAIIQDVFAIPDDIATGIANRDYIVELEV